MKRILFSGILLTLNLCLNAQLSFGKEQVNGSSTLMDFNDSATNTKGIILPAVTSENAVHPSNGNFIFDAEDSAVKMYVDGKWIPLTENGSSEYLTINPSQESGNGIIIGDELNAPEGVLVLESPDMAMILPKIEEPHLNVKSPYPGMMCYDTTSKALAVFDGNHWYYWN